MPERRTDQDGEHPDPLLDDLAALLREQDAVYDAPGLDALARGELPEAERAALVRALGEPAVAAFDPLSEGRKEAYTDRILETLAETPGEALGEAAPADGQAASPAKVVPISRAKRWRWVAGAGAALAAAAVLFLVLRPAALPPPPGFQLDVIGGDSAVRSGSSDAPGRVSLAPGSRLELVLRPEVPSKPAEEAEIRAWYRSGEALAPLGVVPERAAEGAARVVGTREALFGEREGGVVEVILVVARQGAMPTAEEAARGRGEGGWRAYRFEVELVAPP